MPASGPTSDHKEIRSWANLHHAIPAELLPHNVDGEPALLRLLFAEQVREHKDIRVLSWDEFFIKFDGLGLAFVYDDEKSGYYEILEVEEKSPYRSRFHRPATLHN